MSLFLLLLLTTNKPLGFVCFRFVKALFLLARPFWLYLAGARAPRPRIFRSYGIPSDLRCVHPKALRSLRKTGPRLFEFCTNLFSLLSIPMPSSHVSLQ